MYMSRRVPGEIHRQGNEALGDLLEGKDAVEAWGALLGRRVPAGTGGRGVPAVAARQGGAFVLYVNFGRIVVILSEPVVQFPLLGAWIHLTSPSMMYTTPCSIYVSWCTKSCYLHNCITSWPRMNIEHDEE
ncbi:uncharacterized protein [Triticum aestivum]|uniref:uncharacterized protein n=1 Tax=Triticum aestivum TaxID=4565 RepID=UPI001D00F323|nr:uncharacterized protein LOC123163160 [Triticum aestivum]